MEIQREVQTVKYLLHYMKARVLQMMKWNL